MTRKICTLNCESKESRVLLFFFHFCSKNMDPLSASYITTNDSLFKKQYSNSVPALSSARYGGYKVLLLK